jgi:hypothetical protein
MEKRRVADGLRSQMERYNLLGYGLYEIADKAAQLDALREDMNMRIDELEAMGLQVRDLEYGMVDFPAEKGGMEVKLCWVYGEPEVSFWHETKNCYRDRKALKLQLIQP